VVRIYDIFFDYSVLLDTDAFFREGSYQGPSSSAPMSSAEFHYLWRQVVRGAREALGTRAAARCLAAA
jgi:deoxyhypusine synthase